MGKRTSISWAAIVGMNAASERYYTRRVAHLLIQDFLILSRGTAQWYFCFPEVAEIKKKIFQDLYAEYYS